MTQTYELSDIHLVFTVALKQELPIDFLTEHQVPIITLKSLLSGGISSLNSPLGYLIIVTGVGYKNSQAAAHWICKHLAPKYVVNIGTTGNLSKHYSLGDLIIPHTLTAPNAPQLSVDTRIPIPTSIPINYVDSLLSSPSRVAHAPDFDFIDMEAYYQAEIFQDADFSFHVIKCVSDYNDEFVDSMFERGLTFCRKQLTALFQWMDHSAPQITVIIPVYNREFSIKRCIDSVLSQSILPKDIIVIDDFSSDSTVAKLQEYNSRITVVKLLENHGVSFSRNLGVQYSNASWISFLDSDDEWEPTKLENQLAYLKRYPFYQIIQSQENWIRNGETLTQKSYHKKQPGWIWKESLERCMVSPSSVLLSRELFSSFLGFDTDLPACEDYDLWLRITRYHPVGLDVSVSLTKYAGHDNQLSKIYPAMDQYRVKALIKLLEREKNNSYKKFIITILSKKLDILIKGSVKHDNQEKAQYYENILKKVMIV